VLQQQIDALSSVVQRSGKEQEVSNSGGMIEASTSSSQDQKSEMGQTNYFMSLKYMKEGKDKDVIEA
jgi:hypothetical protein